MEARRSRGLPDGPTCGLALCPSMLSPQAADASAEPLKVARFAPTCAATAPVQPGGSRTRSDTEGAARRPMAFSRLARCCGLKVASFSRTSARNS